MPYSKTGKRAYYCDICGNQICNCKQIINDPVSRLRMLEAINSIRKTDTRSQDAKVLESALKNSEYTKEQRKLLQLIAQEVEVSPDQILKLLTKSVTQALEIR